MARLPDRPLPHPEQEAQILYLAGLILHVSIGDVQILPF